jgi:hypothetical protein
MRQSNVKLVRRFVAAIGTPTANRRRENRRMRRALTRMPTAQRTKRLEEMADVVYEDEKKRRDVLAAKSRG